MSADPREQMLQSLLDAQHGGADLTTTQVLVSIDSADKAAGIYRVSLDAAVEAAVRHEYNRWHGSEDAYETTFGSIDETERQKWINGVTDVVTAAVTGGAQ